MAGQWRLLTTDDLAEFNGWDPLEGDGVVVAYAAANLRLNQKYQIRVTVEYARTMVPPEAVGGYTTAWGSFYVVDGGNYDYQYNNAYADSGLVSGTDIVGAGAINGWAPNPAVETYGDELWYDASRYYPPDSESMVDFPQTFEAKIELLDESVDPPDPPDPPGSCFWTDKIGVSEDCGTGGGDLGPIEFVTSSLGGSGGADLVAGDWQGDGPNLIYQTILAWEGFGFDDGPAIRIVKAATEDGTVVYDRAQGDQGCNFMCGGDMSDPDDPYTSFHISSFNVWSGAENKVPYTAIVEFLDSTGAVIGTATGEVTFWPGF